MTQTYIYIYKHISNLQKNNHRDGPTRNTKGLAASLLVMELSCALMNTDYVFVIARRAIPMIAFPQVQTIYIYIYTYKYIYMFVSLT